MDWAETGIGVRRGIFLHRRDYGFDESLIVGDAVLGVALLVDVGNRLRQSMLDDVVKNWRGTKLKAHNVSHHSSES